MNNIEELTDYILRETSNIKKSQYKPRSLQGILTKKQQLTEAIQSIGTILRDNQHRINLRDWVKEVEDFESLKVRVKLAIGILDNTKVLPTDTTKMTTVLEIIKTASALIPSYDGSADKLDSTISAIRAIIPIINDANKAAAINVILSKLTDKARSAVGTNPVSIEVIIQNLTAKCKSTQQPEVVLAKLNALRQTNELVQFTDQIEKLTLDLEKCYLAENVPIDVASKMATKAGIKALANGIRDSQTKIILKAGQFDSLPSAIGKATENYVDNTAHIMSYKASNSQRGRNFFHSRGQNNRGFQRQFSNRNYYHQDNRDNYQRGNEQFRSGFQNRGGNSSRGNHNNLHGYRYNNRGNSNSHSNRRVFYNQSENLLLPQQHVQVGGDGNQTPYSGVTHQHPVVNAEIARHHQQMTREHRSVPLDRIMNHQ